DPAHSTDFRKFREISSRQRRIVALHSKGGYLQMVRGGLEGPEHLAQRCLTRYFARTQSVMGSRHSITFSRSNGISSHERCHARLPILTRPHLREADLRAPWLCVAQLPSGPSSTMKP